MHVMTYLMVVVCALGLGACATERLVPRIPVEVMPLAGDLVDQTRILQSYTSLLSSSTNGEILTGSNYAARWFIYPSVAFDRGGMGTMTTVTVNIRNAQTGQWYARRSYTGIAVIGSENRDLQVEALLNRSVSFVRDSLRGTEKLHNPLAH